MTRAGLGYSEAFSEHGKHPSPTRWVPRVVLNPCRTRWASACRQRRLTMGQAAVCLPRVEYNPWHPWHPCAIAVSSGPAVWHAFEASERSDLSAKCGAAKACDHSTTNSLIHNSQSIHRNGHSTSSTRIRGPIRTTRTVIIDRACCRFILTSVDCQHRPVAWQRHVRASTEWFSSRKA